MTKAKIPESVDYGLPKGFVLDYDFIFHSIEHHKTNGEIPTLSTIEDLERYKHEDYDGSVDCQLLAKNAIGLPSKALGCRRS